MCLSVLNEQSSLELNLNGALHHLHGAKLCKGSLSRLPP